MRSLVRVGLWLLLAVAGGCGDDTVGAPDRRPPEVDSRRSLDRLPSRESARDVASGLASDASPCKYVRAGTTVDVGHLCYAHATCLGHSYEISCRSATMKCTCSVDGTQVKTVGYDAICDNVAGATCGFP